MNKIVVLMMSYEKNDDGGWTHVAIEWDKRANSVKETILDYEGVHPLLGTDGGMIKNRSEFHRHVIKLSIMKLRYEQDNRPVEILV